MDNEDQKKFEQSLDERIVEETTAPAAEQPKRRGRKRKSEQTQQEKPAPVAAEVVQQVPPVDEAEALMFAQMFSGLANLFIKEEYRDRLKFTTEELLSVTRPAVQLKAYYMPGFGGIYAVWTQLAFCAGGLGIAKYNIIREIMDDGKRKSEKSADVAERPTAGSPGGFIIPAGHPDNSSTVAGKENNSDLGNERNGEINKSEGTASDTASCSGL